MSESSEDKKPLIVLTGPTAVGKTELSIRLAQAVNGAVISADSMQVYRGMDIGSAKIRKDQMEGIPHYLVDILDPDEEFNVFRFQELAKQALDEIYGRGQIPILVGGTGFYIQAIIYDIDFTEQDEDPEFRERYERLAEEKGTGWLHEQLRSVDPESAELIHENNIRRTIRALEFYEKSGFPISEHNEIQRQKESPYNFCYFVLDDDRERIYRKIDARVDLMLEEGLVDEVKALRDKGYGRDLVSMQGLGYKEMLAWLDGETSYDEAVRLIKRDTRRFAKRQLTWFKREREVVRIDKADFDYDEDRILGHMLEVLRDKNILQ